MSFNETYVFLEYFIFLTLAAWLNHWMKEISKQPSPTLYKDHHGPDGVDLW